MKPLHRLKTAVLVPVVVVALGAAPALAQNNDVTYSTVDVQGANATAVTGVNSLGDLCGNYLDASHGHHGWIRSSGVTTTFDFPGTNGITFVSGITDSDTVAGAVINHAGTGRGFMRTAGGIFTAINDPLAGPGDGQGTFPVNITDDGVVSGWYIDGQNVAHGFVYAEGTFITVDAPGAGGGTGQGTFPSGTNDQGAMAGNIVGADNVNYGFLERSGHFTTITAPGAGTGPGQGTIPVSIAKDGAVAGQTIDAENNVHSWLLHGQTFTTIDDPQGIGSTLALNGSENGRVVVGVFFAADGNASGFVATVA